MKALLLATTCALIVPSAAFAQTEPPAAPDAAAEAETSPPQPGEGDIIVTAQRRNETLSNVPIAVSAVSNERLQLTGATNIQQLNQLAPSLFVTTTTSETAAVARIRGIGTIGENPGLESSVAVFIDGVYRSRTGAGLSELGEINQIEVLRGPQGTLFGRNASAGLINVTTALPKFEWGGSVEASYGNYDSKRIQASLTGPIAGDTVAARIDGVYFNRDGYLIDAVSGRATNERDRYMLRGQLLIEPSADLRIRLIGDISHKTEELGGTVPLLPPRNLARNPDGSIAILPNSIVPILQGLGATLTLPNDGRDYVAIGAVTPGRSAYNDIRDRGVSGQIDWTLGSANITSITAYRNFVANAHQDSDFGSLDILHRERLRREFKTFSQELRVQGTAFDDRLDYLVGGYYAKETLILDDDLGYGADYERYANCVLADTFARSVGQPLVNTADTSCFNRALAAQLLPNLPASAATPIALLAGLTPGNSLGGYRSVAQAIGFNTSGAFLNNTGIVNDHYRQRSRNFAIFTHNVISIIPDRLKLTLGLRYTSERKTLDAAFVHDNSFCAAIAGSPLAALASLPCVVNGRAGPGFVSGQSAGTVKKESEFSGTAVLSFQAADDLLLYGSYSRGYKAGGYNLDTSALNTSNPQATDLLFEPEFVNAFEIGGKLNLPGFKLNGALFYQAFDQFQLNTFNGVNFQVVNITACKDDLAGGDTDQSAATGACASDNLRSGVISKGLELETFIYPGRNFTVTGGFTLADTKFRKNLTGLDGVPLAPTLFQLPGNRVSNASKYTVNGSISWTPPITESLSALAYLDFRYQSELNLGSDLDQEKNQEGYILFNARVGLYGPDRRWGVELFAQNLFNQRYKAGQADAPLQGGGTIASVQKFGGTANQIYMVYPGEPRFYGVTLKGKF